MPQNYYKKNTKIFEQFYEENYSSEILLEDGIQNIRKIAKEYQKKNTDKNPEDKKYAKAKIYFHMDLDGVTTAIAMREYLKRYNIKTVEVEHIQYGDKSYGIEQTADDVLPVLVDFAQGKHFIKIHTDHHQGQTGIGQDASTKFTHSKSNLETVATISKGAIFSQKDIKFISMIDSADYAKNKIEPKDVIAAILKREKGKGHQNLAFVTNKALLAFKNKPGFLEYVVMKSNPNLVNMYLTIKKWILKWNKENPKKGVSLKKVQQGAENYKKQQKNAIVHNGKIENIDNIKNGQAIKIDNTVIIQYGGGRMWSRNEELKYDRYTVFDNNKNVKYLIIGWPMGLIQISKNPFLDFKNPFNLGELAWKIIDKKFKTELENIYVNLRDIKRMNEKKLKDKDVNAIGFKGIDLETLFYPEERFKNVIKASQNLNKKEKENLFKKLNKIEKNNKLNYFQKNEKIYILFKNKNIEFPENPITDKYGNSLDFKKPKNDFHKKALDALDKSHLKINFSDKNILKNFQISLYDLIKKLSGGHKDITNISGINFAGKDVDEWKPLLLEMMKEFAIALTEKKEKNTPKNESVKYDKILNNFIFELT